MNQSRGKILLVGGSGLLGANLFAMLPHVEWVPTYFAPLIMSCPQAVSLDLSDEIAVSVDRKSVV